MNPIKNKLDKKLEELIQFTNKHESIRALVLQGSYVNENAPLDIFSDLDPLFYVTDVNEFIHDLSWKNEFGEVICNWGDAWDMKDGQKGYTRLTLYKDGFKLDFGFQHISLAQYANDMPLYQVIIDKDNIVPKREVSDERKFYVTPPTEKEFNDILLDFFFDTSYVVKSIYREELFFEKFMENILHNKIFELLKWYIGTTHNYQVNIGSMGRYFKRYLTNEEKTMLQNTYPNHTKQEQVKALYAMFELVRYLGKKIASHHNFTYPTKLDLDMYTYCDETIKNKL